MPLGPGLRWRCSSTCDAIRRMPGGRDRRGGGGRQADGGGPGAATFTLTGVPAAVDGAPGVLVTSRVFEMSCEGQVEELRYSEGSATSQKFECQPGCDLSLRVVLADESGTQIEEVSRVWDGDTACDDFLQDGKLATGDVREWKIAGPNGSNVRARYRLSAPKKDKSKGKRRAPSRSALPGGLGG